jgi:hypothetical protein
MRSIFGWSYPPGAANDPNAPWNQEPGPCAVCAKDEDNCVCPECPVCGMQGDPACYYDSRETKRPTGVNGHGLKLTRAQLIGRAEAETERRHQEAVDAGRYLCHLQDEGGEFSDDMADNPDPWR